MLHRERNALITYVFLVILPILGLVGVIRKGRNLKAPARASVATPTAAANAANKGTR